MRIGTLPNYSFIEPAHNSYYSPPGRPRQTNSQHPGNNLDDDRDFYAGEQLVKDVYQSLLDQPSLFAKTLLVIVYDEQGGLYDHAAADKSVPPGDPVYRGWTRWIGRFFRRISDRRHHQERKKFYDFSGLGVRVPAVLVSPWIQSGTLVSKTLDHASIPRTLHDLFAPDMKFLTKRDAAAAGFHDVVTGSPLARPRPNPRHPDGSDGADHLRPLPDLDRLPEVVASTATATAEPEADDPPAAEPAADAEPEADDVVFPHRQSADEATVSGELDRHLLALAERVHRKLEGKPAVAIRVRLAARRAPVPAPAPEGVAAPSAASRRPPEAHPVGLFTEKAKRARRRPHRA